MLRNESHPKTIGLIGGIGSDATIAAYQKIIQISRERSQLSPHLLINNLPQDNIFDYLDERISAMICDGISDLAAAGAQVVGISCNTAHIYRDQILNIAQRHKIDFINIIDAVSNSCIERDLRSVGILATSVACGLYEESLNTNHVTTLLPNSCQQLQVNAAIRQVLTGHVSRNARVVLDTIAASLLTRGARAIILGCTELPLIFDVAPPSPYICSISVLADSLVTAAYSH